MLNAESHHFLVSRITHDWAKAKRKKRRLVTGVSRLRWSCVDSKMWFMPRLVLLSWIMKKIEAVLKGRRSFVLLEHSYMSHNWNKNLQKAYQHLLFSLLSYLLHNAKVVSSWLLNLIVSARIPLLRLVTGCGLEGRWGLILFHFLHTKWSFLKVDGFHFCRQVDPLRR